MEAFLVVLRRDGPEWDPALPLEAQPRFAEHARFVEGLVTDGFLLLGGPLADEQRVVYVVEAASEEAARERLAQDPWISLMGWPPANPPTVWTKMSSLPKRATRLSTAAFAPAAFEISAGNAVKFGAVEF